MFISRMMTDSNRMNPAIRELFIAYKRIICLIITACVTNCYSQSISISSFKLLDTDLTANTAGTMELDQNGETAALIKMVTTQTGFTFDGGALGIVKTKQTPGEVWVYIPRGSKKISVKHPQLGVLRDYYFPCAIEAARTYEMVLISGEVRTIVKEKANSQYIVIQVSPANAIIEFDNEFLPTNNGYAQKFVKLGTYEYRVQAKDYHTTAGKVTIDDPNNKKMLEVNLKPAFGWIEIPDNEEYNGAQVFIDNTLAGTIPMKSRNLSSGEHNLKIVKSLYNPFSQIVTVKDNEATQVKPLLTANYSEVTISVDNDAEIYITEEKKANGLWKGKLELGSYKFEAKKEGHRGTSQNVEITKDQVKQNFHLNSPTPIYGSLNITSTPSMADILIDGKSYDKTPLYLPQILAGTHNISIKLKNHKNYYAKITIDEDKILSKNIVLEEQIEPEGFVVIVTSKKHDINLYIDGKSKGVVNKGTKTKLFLYSGSHLFEADRNVWGEKTKYKFKKRIEITENEQVIDI